MATEVAVRNEEDEREARRKLALLKAVGLDRAAPEQRELALAIAKRYDLDLLLKHLVLVDGKPYITRDALLWIAHRSGQFDGISVTKPLIEGDYWYAEATVYRKDMSHPFVYGGRYPVKGKNAAFGPEMAVKVAESMGLRRAFNVSAPSQDERWDVDMPAEPQAPAPRLAELAAQRAQAVRAPSPAQIEDGDYAGAMEPDVVGKALPTEVVTDAGVSSSSPASVAQIKCDAFHLELGQCRKEAGHENNHQSSEGSWK